MTDVLQQLASALRERLGIIADKGSRRDEAAHIVRLQTVSARIEEIEQRLPPDCDPQLRHYLRRRSYSKALDFVEDAESAPSA